jgi:hypothetical protein
VILSGLSAHGPKLSLLIRLAKAALPWLGIILTGIVAANIATHLVSLRDSERLVPIQIGDIADAVRLMSLLYACGALLVVLLWRIPDRLGFFTVFFTLRLAMALVLTELFEYDDERAFHIIGLNQIYGLFSSDPGQGYDYIVNVLYETFGSNILLPKMVNVFLGSLLPFFVYDIARKVFQDRMRLRRSLLYTGLLPPMVVYSAVNLKEIATAFLVVLTVWSIARPQAILCRMIGLVSSIAGLYWLRGTVWALIAVVGGVTWLLSGEGMRAGSLLRVRTAIRIGLVSLVFVIFILPSFGQPIAEMVVSRLTQETYFIERFTTSEASVMQFIDVENPLAPRNFVVLFLRGLFSPSPLRFLFDYGLDTMIEAVNMLTWYLVFPLGVVGFLSERGKGIVVICAVVVMGILTLSFGGLVFGGDPYRHRVTAYGLLSILAAGEADKDAIHGWRWVLYLWWGGAALFTGLWFIMRT